MSKRSENTPENTITAGTMRNLVCAWLASHSAARATLHNDRARDLAVQALRLGEVSQFDPKAYQQRTKLQDRARNHLLRSEAWKEAAALANRLAEQEGQ